MASIRAEVHAQTFLAAHQFVMAALKHQYSSEQLTKTAGQSHTNIVWSIGHLVWAYDVATAWALGLKPEAPESYNKLFSFGTRPSSRIEDYPSLETLTQQMEAAAERLAAHIASMSDADLAKPLPPEHPLAPFFPSRDAVLSVAPFHSGYHVGQIALLRTSQGLPGVMGG
ncbi:DUF664 domain-containing protein [bacterium]|nr:DUF664 domain-containing protein [bacterium]